MQLTDSFARVHKDLRMLLTPKKVRGKFSRRYCGKGKRAACRALLRATLGEALFNEALEALITRDGNNEVVGQAHPAADAGGDPVPRERREAPARHEAEDCAHHHERRDEPAGVVGEWDPRHTGQRRLVHHRRAR